MGELKANLGLNGDSVNHQRSRSRGRSSGGCCSSSSSTSTWSWLLFVLVLVSLAVSILVFWMTLYKQQELAMRLLGLEEERNRTLHDMVGKEMSNLKLLAMRNERVLEEHTKELQNLLDRLSDSEMTSDKMAHSEMQLREWTQAEVDKVRTAHGGVINRLAEKVDGWELTNGVTLRTLHKLKESLDSAKSTGEEGVGRAGQNSEGIQEVREDVDGLWESVNRLTQRVNQQQQHIMEVKSLSPALQSLRTELTSLLSSSERATDAKLERMALVATEALEEAEEAREEANQIREGVEGVSNATVELGERMEEMEARWRGHRREEEEDMAEELEWREQILLDLQLVNRTLLSQLEHALDRAVREAKFNQSMEEDEEDATEVVLLTTTAPISSTVAPEFSSADLSRLESDLSLLRSELSAVESTMAKAVDANAERIDSLELFVSEEVDGVKKGVDDNKEGLAHLLNRVNHFVRSLLKVKTLPAEVRTMERRLEALDESLAKIVQGGGEGGSSKDGDVESELVALTQGSHWWNKGTRH